MSTQVTLKANQSAAIYLKVDSDFTSTIFLLQSSFTGYMLTSFASPSSQYRYRKIESVQPELYSRVTFNDDDFGCFGAIDVIDAAFAEKNVKYSDFVYHIRSSQYAETGISFDPTSSATYVKSNVLKGAPAWAALKYGFAVSSISGEMQIHSSRGTNPPRVVVTFSDDNNKLTLMSTSPASGSRLNRDKSNLFYAVTGMEAYSYDTPTTASGVLRWRKTGDTVVHELAVVAGATPQVTVPEGTFPGGSIDYQFRLVSTSGNTVTSNWVTISLSDAISSARAISPSGTVEDGNKPIPFVWEHINASGAAQTKADIQIGPPNGYWSDLATVSGSGTKYNAPAGSIASGTWYWRVRTYNLDGVAGSWSAQLKFMAVTSPTKPNIIVTSSGPRPSIQWQTSEQEAYQLQLKGIWEENGYGPEKTWKCPQYLEDGSYTVRVRSQNIYGLWSDWGEKKIVVSNKPGNRISLTVRASHEAELIWSRGNYDYYIVYRNSVPIAKTVGNTYTDRWSIGIANYQVRGCYSQNVYYGLSNEVSIVVAPDTVMIAAVAEGEWMRLELSDSQHRTTKKSMGRDITTMQIAGHKYPVAEISGFYNRSLSVTCAFTDQQDCARLEAFLGRLVCLKDKRGNMSIGYISSLEETSSEFYAVYSFTVPQIDFEEAIDLDAGDLI